MTDREELGRLADDAEAMLNGFHGLLGDKRETTKRIVTALRHLAEAGTQEAAPVRWEWLHTSQMSGNQVWRTEQYWNGHTSKTSRPLYTAPPAPSVAVTVKALEWVQRPMSDVLRAESITGPYCVWTHHEANGQWFWNCDGAEGAADTLEAAKAAAQADYEQRITSALITAPQDDVREALKACRNYIVSPLRMSRDEDEQMRRDNLVALADAALRGNQSDVEAFAATTAERPGTIVREPEPSTSGTTPSSRPEVSVDDVTRIIYGALPSFNWAECEVAARAVLAKYHMEGRE